MKLIDNLLEKLNYDKSPAHIEEIKKHKRAEVSLGVDFLCEAKGHGGIACTGSERKAHIMTQQFLTLRTNKLNILKLCQGHEYYFNKVGVREWFKFVKKEYPEHFKFVMENHGNAMSQLRRAQYVLDEYLIFMDVAK